MAKIPFRILCVSAPLREIIPRSAAAALACLFATTVFSEEPVVETLLDKLRSPAGIAVRPGDTPDRYEVFIAESGAGRIIHVRNDEPTKIAEIVTGFDLTPLGENGMPVGPVALHFIDRDHLVVGVSGAGGKASVRLYELTGESTPQSADSAKQTVQLAAGENSGTPGREHVYAITRTRPNDVVPDSLVVSCFSNDQAGELQRIAVRAGTLGNIQNFVKAATTSPAALATSAQGYVVASWVGQLDKPRDSRIVFYSPVDGSPRLELATDLHDVLGLAYSQKTGNLYAVDAAWMASSEGGVFRIDNSNEPAAAKAIAVKIASAIRPSSLAFAPDGTLYVTAFGTLEGGAADQGQLLHIRGDL